MIPRSLFGATMWLPMLLLYALLIPAKAEEEAIITLLQNPAWSYRAELANFGYMLDQRLRYNANFMTPPMNETQLCSFPSFSLINLDRASRLNKPVALLVSLGGCSTGQKVEVALQIHKKVTNFLRFIVFYNNDPNNPDEIFPVDPPSNNTIYLDDLEEMSFSAISTATSSAILAHMERASLDSGKTPDFLGPTNDGWMLEMIIETAANPYVNTRSTSDRTFGNSNFYWFRIVLFALLVLSPFCRAMFLWWTGGGRIRLRRNENGRIVGFLYTPPMAYWFVSHGTQEPEPVADTMTTEEVMALPEIVYKPPTSEALGTTTEVLSDDSDDNVSDKPVAENSDDGRLIKVVDRASATASQTTTEISTDENGSPMTTCSTACSICIDDFEEGEKIRLLRCGHAFHTECILPWLTRRQGCCPMCKKSVIPAGDEETNTAVESVPFSRCLEIQSGMDSTEEPAAPPEDRTVPAGGDFEASDDNIDVIESATLPEVDTMEDLEQGADHLANAVVSGFADSLKSECSHDADMDAGEKSQTLLDDSSVPIVHENNEEADLLEMENSEQEVDNVESPTMPLDEKVEPTLQIGTDSAVVGSDTTEQEVSTAEIDLSNEIKAAMETPEDLEQVDNEVMEDSKSFDLPDQDGLEESPHATLHDDSEAPVTEVDEEAVG